MSENQRLLYALSILSDFSLCVSLHFSFALIFIITGFKVLCVQCSAYGLTVMSTLHISHDDDDCIPCCHWIHYVTVITLPYVFVVLAPDPQLVLEKTVMADQIVAYREILWTLLCQFPCSVSPYVRILSDCKFSVLLCATAEAEGENVDDRCESDISGIATEDSDLSSMSVGADIAMEMGSVVYRHQPNPIFNTLLTCCTVLMLCFAGGIGVGHYFGRSPAVTALSVMSFTHFTSFFIYVSFSVWCDVNFLYLLISSSSCVNNNK